jgi:DNA-damage-inducible protein J
MTQIQIRIDEKTKKSVQDILEELGLDMSSAIKIYLKQIVIQKGIPLHIVTENGLTIAEERKILINSKEAKRGKNISKKMNAKELQEYLKNHQINGDNIS